MTGLDEPKNNKQDRVPRTLELLSHFQFWKNTISFLLCFSLVLFVFASLPDSALFYDRIKNFRNEHLQYIICAAVFSLAAAGLSVERDRKNTALRKLKDLKPSEKKVLAKYVSANKLALHFPDTNIVVQSLSEAQVIKKKYITHRSVDFSGPYTMNSWVLKYLNKHPELLKR